MALLFFPVSYPVRIEKTFRTHDFLKGFKMDRYVQSSNRRGPRGMSSVAVLALCLLLLGTLFLCSCGKKADVVIYCALDRNFSEPLIQEFEARTGLKVDAQYDVEATKTIGLVRKIKEEMPRPRCDIFWNNEIANTIRLKNMGALAPYKSPNAVDIPDTFKDSEGYWTGFAARARVFIVNTELLPDRDKWPTSYADLVAAEWKGKGGMAKPLTGTTATHGAVLVQKLGDEKARAFFTGVCENDVYLTSGNAHLIAFAMAHF